MSLDVALGCTGGDAFLTGCLWEVSPSLQCSIRVALLIHTQQEALLVSDVVDAPQLLCRQATYRLTPILCTRDTTSMPFLILPQKASLHPFSSTHRLWRSAICIHPCYNKLQTGCVQG